MFVGGLRCTSDEQIKEQAYQSHGPACITYMYKDNEGGIHKEGQISLSCTEMEEATINTLAHVISYHNIHC